LEKPAENWPYDFVRGIISECIMNDNGEIRFKTTRPERALRVIRSLASVDRIRLITQLSGDIQAGTPKQGDYRACAEYRNKFCRTLGDLIESDTDMFGCYEPLRDTVSDLTLIELED